MLRRWPSFTLFLGDGKVCLTNNAAERAVRGIAVGAPQVIREIEGDRGEGDVDPAAGGDVLLQRPPEAALWVDEKSFNLGGLAEGEFDDALGIGDALGAGPVFEVELLLDTKDEKGRPVRFGSVGGGGRYDGLVSRFRGEPVPATGFSIGVSRLQAALTLIGKLDTKPEFGPLVVTVFDRDRVADYQKMVAELRNANIRAELYLGNPKNMGNQLKYADRRNSPCVIIQGSDEKARGEVQIKDLIEGAKAAAAIASNQEWRETRPAQFSCAEGDIVAKVREVLARHDVNWG